VQVADAQEVAGATGVDRSPFAVSGRGPVVFEHSSPRPAGERFHDRAHDMSCAESEFVADPQPCRTFCRGVQALIRTILEWTAGTEVASTASLTIAPDPWQPR
jgi:hypothetical protein